MKGNIFVVVAVENQKGKDAGLSKIIMEPVTVVANNDKDAAIKAAMGCDAMKGKDMDRIEVVVRPF